MVPYFIRLLTVLLFGLALLLPGRPGAATAALANDDFANATVISVLPFTDSVDLDGTTTESGEPQSCGSVAQTAWYAFTPSATIGIKIDPLGSDAGVLVGVYQSFGGGGVGGLGFVVGCSGIGNPLSFIAVAGTTYYVQAGSGSVGPKHLRLSVRGVPPPTNDDFANAKSIAAPPFADSVDLTNATIEASEPTDPTGEFVSLVASAWYAFVPDVTGSVTATASSPEGAPFVTVYTGSSLTGLSVVAVQAFGTTFRAIGGTTYYLQVGRGNVFGGVAAPTSLRLDATPPPVANIVFSPSDPSIFDTVQFFDNVSDPVFAGIRSEAWTLSDGSDASGCCPQHRFAADADYTVHLALTTTDGRTASASQIVHVKTHDVSITKLVAPASARAGRTSRITARISDTRYAETVQVQLFKSVPGGGLQLVGTLTQSIPVRPKNQTTPFDFDYTFNSDDATVGKVTFEAVATTVNVRDALPADNTAIAPPTKVTP